MDYFNCSLDTITALVPFVAAAKAMLFHKSWEGVLLSVNGAHTTNRVVIAAMVSYPFGCSINSGIRIVCDAYKGDYNDAFMFAGVSIGSGLFNHISKNSGVYIRVGEGELSRFASGMVAGFILCSTIITTGRIINGIKK
jgi:hypothetical protein